MRVVLRHQNGATEARHFDVPSDLDPKYVSLTGAINVRTSVFENINPSNVALVHRMTTNWMVFIVSAEIQQNIKKAWTECRSKGE